MQYWLTGWLVRCYQHIWWQWFKFIYSPSLNVYGCYKQQYKYNNWQHVANSSKPYLKSFETEWLQLYQWLIGLLNFTIIKQSKRPSKGWWAQWWSSKWLHFLFLSPDRKWQHFPACCRSICAIFSRKGDSRDVQRNGVVKNGFTFCFASQTGSCSIFRSLIDWSVPFSHFKRHHCVRHPEKPPSWDYGTNQEEAGKYWTSCLARETGSDDILDFTVAFSKSRNPLPVKMARINQ